MFFHNRHDAGSRALLKTLQGDPANVIELYDVFDFPPPRIPANVRPWKYPFVITKQFVVLQPDSLSASVAAGMPFTVKLGCFYLDGGNVDPAAEQSVAFHVYVNGALYGDVAAAEAADIAGAQVPVLTFNFDVPSSAELRLRVEAEGYLPFDEVFKIVVS